MININRLSSNNYSSFLKGSLLSFLGIIINQFVGIIFRIVLARHLTQEEFGIISLGIAIVVTTALLSLMGYQQGIVRFVALYDSSHQADKVRACIMSVLYITLVSSITGGIIIFLFSDSIAINFFKNNQLESVLKLFAITIPLYGIITIANSVLRGLKKIHLMIITENILWRILPLLFFIGFYYLLGLKFDSAIYAFLISIIIMFIIATTFLFKEVIQLPSPNNIKKHFKDLSSFSLPLSLVNITNNIQVRADIFILGFLLNEAEIAIFIVATTIAAVMNLFLQSVVTIFNPIASGLYSEHKIEEIGTFFATSVRWLYWLTLPILAFFLIIPGEILSTLFGAMYQKATVVFCILSISFFIKTIVGPTGATLLAIGRSQTFMKINIVSVIIALSLNILLIPLYNVIGAAIATGIATIFQQFSMLIIVKKHIIIKILRANMFFYCMYIALISLLFKIFSAHYISSIFLLFIISCIFYTISLGGIFITKQLDKGEMNSLISLCINIKGKLM